MLFKRDLFFWRRKKKKNSVALARWVPYLLFLKDFRVTTAQMRSKSAVALTDSPGEQEGQLFPFT